MSTGFESNASVLDRILGSIPEYVLLVDLDLRIRYINRPELRSGPEQVLGMDIDRMMPPGSRQEFQDAFNAVEAGTESVEYESEAIHPDGTHAWYKVRMSPYHNDGELVGVVLVSTDVTELRLAQQSVKVLRTLLPICAWCQRIRDDSGAWETMEDFVAREAGARITHGLCKDCYERQMAGL